MATVWSCPGGMRGPSPRATVSGATCALPGLDPRSEKSSWKIPEVNDSSFQIPPPSEQGGEIRV